MTRSKVVFVHLSDIHYKKFRGGQLLDMDSDLRNELEIDVEGQSNRFEKVYGILVTGDIAFSGKNEEYEIVQEWLTKISEKVGCGHSDIWVTAGNHDVNREAIRKNPFLKLFHKNMREKAVQNIDEEIVEYYDDQETINILFSGLDNYNVFASKYGCDYGKGLPWKFDVSLNDGSTLRLIGLNSAFISDENDNDTINKLVLGSFQRNIFERKRGREFMALSHHPPQWLRDEDATNELLNARARIQLFGHKHKQKIEQINNIVRVSAGAIHPDRGESDWIPRYNWLEINVENIDGNRFLNLNVYPRVWDDTEKKFKADFSSEGKDYRNFMLQLEEWSATNPQTHCNDTDEASQEDIECIPAENESENDSIGISIMNQERELIYKFFSLSYDSRLSVVQELKLIENKDEGVKGIELFKRCLRRAKDRNQYKELWVLVEKLCNPDSTNENPF